MLLLFQVRAFLAFSIISIVAACIMIVLASTGMGEDRDADAAGRVKVSGIWLADAPKHEQNGSHLTDGNCKSISWIKLKDWWIFINFFLRLPSSL